MSLPKHSYPESGLTDDGDVIIRLMTQKNITQGQLAERLSVSQSLLSRILHGTRWINRELERRIVAEESSADERTTKANG